MRRLLQLAFLLAIPFEVVVFVFFSYPLETGFQPSDSLPRRTLDSLWLVLHWPSLFLLRWLERHNAAPLTEMVLFVLPGYLTSVLLIFLGLLSLRWIGSALHSHPAIRAH